MGLSTCQCSHCGDSPYTPRGRRLWPREPWPQVPTVPSPPAVAWGQGGFAMGWPTSAGFSPHPQPETHPSHGNQTGISPLPYALSFCSWRGLGAVDLPRVLAYPWREVPMQILLAGAVGAAGVMLQSQHGSREDTSSDISVSKVVMRSPMLCPCCWCKTWTSLCRAKGFSAQCPWLLLPVASYLGRAEPTSGTQPRMLGVTEPQIVI